MNRRTGLPVVGLLLVLAGCGRDDIGLIDRALNEHPFFTSLGTIPPAEQSYADSSPALNAWRSLGEPDVDYEILVQEDQAIVNIIATWPCTLRVVYGPVAAFDTVAKPGPELTGLVQARFKYDDGEWRMAELSVCDARSDSGFRFLELDSLKLHVRRGGDTVAYPGVRDMSRRSLDPYAFTFLTGDSVDLVLWHWDSVDAPRAYLHTDRSRGATPFVRDSLGTWSCSWALSDTGRHWVWFEVIDIADAVTDPDGPDRAVFWGVPWIVENPPGPGD